MSHEDLSSLHVAIVGAGVVGIHSALLLTRRGAKVTILERESGKGGVWRYFANAGSRVQVAEPGYRLIPERPLADFTQKAEVLSTLDDALAMVVAAGGRVVYDAQVVNVENVGSQVLLHYESVGERQCLTADHAMLCVGGLQKPCSYALPEEACFQGPVIDGLGGAPDAIDMRGKQVLILGMGAFAVENARECLFRGAAHVTLLARNRNQVINKLWMYLGLAQEQDYMTVGEQRRLAERAAQASANTSRGRAPVMAPSDLGMVLVQSYELANAQDAMPNELREFARTKDPRMLQRAKESFGTIPTGSDAFFIGHALGKLNTVRGEVARVLADGVETVSGDRINADVIIKNFGFEDPDAWVADVVNQSHMHSPMVINERVWLCKCERAKVGSLEAARKEGRGAFDDMLNIPAVAPCLAATFTELFCYFQARPQKLSALIEEGKLPRVEIGKDTPLSLSRGLWAMIQSDPELAQRVNRHRRQIAVDMKRRWTATEYFQSNREWWRFCCKSIGGHEDCVPYIWEHLEPMFQMLDQMPAKEAKASKL